MTAQQLKNSILQMAVQGKLVSQDPNDEPASILLERIRAEKKQMIKDGKIKKEKNPSIIFHGDDNLPYEKVGDSEPVCIADELPFDIPDSWEWARFGEIVLNFDNQRKPVAKDKRTTTHGYYDYYGATGAIDKVDNYIFEGEYLMIGEDGGNFFTERDNSFIADGKFWANNHVHVVCPVVINIWFLKFFLDSCNLPAMGLINGIAVPKLNQEHLNSIIVPIPPIQEQEAIVEKVKIFLPLLNYYDVAEKQLSSLEERFPNQLKKSILQQAVQGKLVPQDPNNEPASVLLERIRAEKKQMIKDGKIKRDKHESAIYRKDDSFYEKVDGVERCIDDEIPFEIPESWEWVRLGTVSDVARGGSPRPIKQFLTDAPDGINWIKIGDTDKGGKYIYSTKEKIIPAGVSKSRKVHSGDFLLTNSMSFGRPYILKTDGCIHDGWLVLSGYQKCYNIDFLYYMLSSSFAYYQFCDVVSGAVVKNLNSDKVSNSLFPVPPINEQKRIVLKLEEIMIICDDLNSDQI